MAEPVLVGVIDSGWPLALQDRVLAARSFVASGRDAQDRLGHGTRTLGALCGNLPGIYIGVCPSVPVVPYRVTNGVMLTGQTILNVANAIMDAVDRNLADVISISLGVQSIIGNIKQMHALGRAVDHAYLVGQQLAHPLRAHHRVVQARRVSQVRDAEFQRANQVIAQWPLVTAVVQLKEA